jgi:hypothetical protein
VGIRLNSCLVQRGVVDLAMPDSSALWLLCTDGGNRRYVSKEEGYEAWISPETSNHVHGARAALL